MRLSSDNPQLMPITDAVYGKPPKRKSKPFTAIRRRQGRTIASAIPEEVLHALGQG